MGGGGWLISHILQTIQNSSNFSFYNKPLFFLKINHLFKRGIKVFKTFLNIGFPFGQVIRVFVFDALEEEKKVHSFPICINIVMTSNLEAWKGYMLVERAWKKLMLEIFVPEKNMRTIWKCQAWSPSLDVRQNSANCFVSWWNKGLLRADQSLGHIVMQALDLFLSKSCGFSSSPSSPRLI